MKSKDRERLREAVALALAGDWQSAHEIAQQYEDDRNAFWLHAVVHRMEGDIGNARYWYRRARREPREELATEQELKEIAAALGKAEEGQRP